MRNFAMKKLVGAASWHLTRRFAHQPKIANALRADILASKPDHVAFTGDLVNISAWQEFDAGLAWLQQLGSPDFISYTPGNHDAYVPLLWDHGLGKFSPYMSNENPKDTTFPFIRLRRNVALIGVNAACPQNLLRAGGTVGRSQRVKLQETLKSLHQRGFYRAVMIHHPPAPGLAHAQRSLSDAAEMYTLLQSEGAELVIHGHNHVRSLSHIESKTGRIPIVGVPSASMKPLSRHDVAAWNMYEIERLKGQWQTRVHIRQWSESSQSMIDGERFLLASNSS